LASQFVRALRTVSCVDPGEHLGIVLEIGV